jgi:predicted  nucleic acid-binding Zn-ribbon protein
MADYDLFGEIPVTHGCTECGKHYLGLPGLCPKCEGERDFYQRSRKKGDRKKFIPYEELFKEWQARKKEVRALRSAAATAQHDRNEREKLEVEKRWLLLALNNTLYDKNLLHAVVFAQRDLEDVTKERDRLKASNEDLLERVMTLTKEVTKLRWDQIGSTYDALRQSLHSSTAIPGDMLKRLKMLAHPDRHGNSEMSTKVMQWLNSL